MWGTGSHDPVKMAFLGQPHLKTRTNTTGGAFIMSKTSGAFRKKKVYFSQISNVAIRDKELSLKAKGLYSLIQSYITLENFILYKNTLKKQCQEGNYSFEAAWKELKDKQYLIQHKIKDNKTGLFYYEYELLDRPIQTPVFQGVDNPLGGKGGVYNKTDINNTDLNNTEKYNGVLQGQDPNILFPPDRPPKDINNEEIILDTVKRLLVKENHPEYFVDYEVVLNHYFQRYKERTGKQHPPLTKQSCSRIVDTLFKAYDEGYSIDLDLDYGDLLDMIDKHFETKYKHTDWNIMHFLSDGVKVRRMFEVAY
jgi:hypothetical protein